MTTAAAVADWRMAVAAGGVAGLIISPFLDPGSDWLRPVLALVLVTIFLVERDRAALPGLALIALVAALAGLIVGNARLDSIDSGALRAPPGPVVLEGHATEPASGARGVFRFAFDSERGRVLIESRLSEVAVGPGTGLEVRGSLGPAPEWQRQDLRRRGISMVLRADLIESNGSRRSGLAGVIDRLRDRAFDALELAVPQREAALSRGFVLGDDSDIDRRTTEDFRRSGLAHLLAVSGQNVVLLALLAVPFLALAGIPPRARLLAVGALILLYIPLAGGGPSIQRAGVMGIAGLVAIGAARAPSRLYALALAALVTLTLDPRASADIGWQLSFSAVIGIMLLARPLAVRLTSLIGESDWRRALSEGIAVTVAATIATLSLTAFHFERLPVATVAANLLAMPAVAPAMWSGMIGIALGQVSPQLAIPFNLAGSLALSWIAEVAKWFGRPGWAVLEVTLPSVGALIAATGGVAGLVWLLLRLWPAGPARRHHSGLTIGAVAVALVTVLLLIDGGGRRELAAPELNGARVEFLDVGQGDAILIRPWQADPILIDGGPPGGDLSGALRSAGVTRLSTILLTHADLDHYGGLLDVFGLFEVERLLFDQSPAELLALARQHGATLQRINAATSLRSGDITLRILWPPHDSEGQHPTVSPEGTNERSVVALLKWQRFRMLLTGDAESEAVPIDPGPIDVLKVAHHGSADSGLPGLLTRTRPRLAVISAGQDNRFGHPVPELLGQLRQAGVETLRTDQNGTISVILQPSGRYAVEQGR